MDGSEVTKTPEELTFADFKALYSDGIDPLTGEYDWELQERFIGAVEYEVWGSDKELLGGLEAVTSWNGGDGREMGCVTRHVPSGTLILASGWYSSWDSSSIDDIYEAEGYTFSEFRYREKQ